MTGTFGPLPPHLVSAGFLLFPSPWLCHKRLGLKLSPNVAQALVRGSPMTPMRMPGRSGKTSVGFLF
jgi:hypothetical protein